MKSDSNNFPSSQSPFLSVRQFSEKHGWPIGGLRHLIFHKPDGFEKVIRKVGAKVLIHERAFFSWIDEVNGIESDTTECGS